MVQVSVTDQMFPLCNDLYAGYVLLPVEPKADSLDLPISDFRMFCDIEVETIEWKIHSFKLHMAVI